MSRMGDQRGEVVVGEALPDVMAVVEGQVEVGSERTESKHILGCPAHRTDVRLDREAQTASRSLGRTPLHLLARTSQRRLMRLPWPVRARDHRDPRGSKATRQLDDVA